MVAGVATRQVGWSVRPWCGFAGTVCLSGFCRKHHGAHVCPHIPARLRDIEDSGIATAMRAWTRQATNPSTSASPLIPPESSMQHAWDDPCCKVQADRILDAASDQVERVRLLASRSNGSGDWLHALSLSSAVLKMMNTDVCIAGGLRLGAPIVRPHQCVCGAMVTVDGHHGLSCRHGSGRHVTKQDKRTVVSSIHQRWGASNA